MRLLRIDRRAIEQHPGRAAGAAAKEAARRGFGSLHHAGHRGRTFGPQRQSNPLSSAATISSGTG